jgi:hypothetical protein
MESLTLLLFVCSLVRSLLVFLGGGGFVLVYGKRKPARSRAPVCKTESPVMWPLLLSVCLLGSVVVFVRLVVVSLRFR